MDRTKLRQLRAMRTVIPPVCGLCRHGTFYGGSNLFGGCDKRQYQHEKHTGPVRPLSVCRYMLCDCEHFELDQQAVLKLQHFAVFVETDMTPTGS